MNRIKLFIAITVTITISLTFFSCGNNEVNVKEKVNKQCDILIECLSKNDTDGIRDLFCTAVVNSQNFDNDLENAIEFFDGEIIAYDLKGIGSDEKSEHEKKQYVHVSPKIYDIQTSTGKSYKVYYYAYIENLDNPQYVGISEIQIINNEGDEVKIGDYFLANPK